jgi:hypothetical protein
MECPNCHSETPDHSKICEACGAASLRSLPVLRPQSRWCKVLLEGDY